MTLEANLDATADGDVIFVFEVTNTGSDPVELTFTSGQTADLTVFEADGDDQVWQWSRGRMFTQAMRYPTLQPGETVSEELTWEDPPSGEYRARGTLAARERDVSAETTLTV